MLVFHKECFDALSFCHRVYYSDGRLCSFARKCIVQDIGLESFNADVKNVLEFGLGAELPNGNGSPSGSCLHKVARRLPSSFGRSLIKYEGHKAVAIKYGNHYAGYVWLVAVDTAEHIKFDDDKVRRIADNIAVVTDSNKM